MKPPILLAFLGLATAQAAEPTGTLTLACQGTYTTVTVDADLTQTGGKATPVSMGIIVDFTARTVHGFGEPVPIIDVSEEEVSVFIADDAGAYKKTVTGRIYRVTGDVKVISEWWNLKTYSSIETEYSLKCKPTQRMF